MKKSIKNNMIIVGLAPLLLTGIGLQAAQELERNQEQERNLSPAALQELVALCGDLEALLERAWQEDDEAVGTKIAAGQRKLEALEARLRAEGKNEEEINGAGQEFVQLFKQEGEILLEQRRIIVSNKITELLIVRAPTLLAEDPDLKHLFKLG